MQNPPSKDVQGAEFKTRKLKIKSPEVKGPLKVIATRKIRYLCTLLLNWSRLQDGGKQDTQVGSSKVQQYRGKSCVNISQYWPLEQVQ